MAEIDYVEEIASTAKRLADFLPPIARRISAAVDDRDSQLFYDAVLNLNDVMIKIGYGLSLNAFFEFKEAVIEDFGSFSGGEKSVRAVFEWTDFALKLFQMASDKNPIVWNIARSLSDSFQETCNLLQDGADWLEDLYTKNAGGARSMRSRLSNRKADVVHPSEDDLQKVEYLLEVGEYVAQIIPSIYEALMDAYRQKDDAAFADALIDLAQPGHKYPDVYDVYVDVWDIIKKSVAQESGAPPPNTLGRIIDWRNSSKDLSDYWGYSKRSFHSKEFPANQEYIEQGLKDLKKNVDMSPEALRWLETWLLRYDTEKSLKAIRSAIRASKATDSSKLIYNGIQKAVEDNIAREKLIFSTSKMSSIVSCVEPVSGTPYIVETYGVVNINPKNLPYVIECVYTLCAMLRPRDVTDTEAVENILTASDSWLDKAKDMGYLYGESDEDLGLFANDIIHTEYTYSYVNEGGSLADEDVITDIIDDLSHRVVASLKTHQEVLQTSAKVLAQDAAKLLAE